MPLLVKAAVCFVHTICCCGLQRKKRGRRSVGNAVDLRHATFCLFFRWGVKFPNFTEKNSHQWYHARIEQKNTRGAVRHSSVAATAAACAARRALQFSRALKETRHDASIAQHSLSQSDRAQWSRISEFLLEFFENSWKNLLPCAFDVKEWPMILEFLMMKK